MSFLSRIFGHSPKPSYLTAHKHPRRLANILNKHGLNNPGGGSYLPYSYRNHSYFRPAPYFSSGSSSTANRLTIKFGAPGSAPAKFQRPAPSNWTAQNRQYDFAHQMSTELNKIHTNAGQSRSAIEHNDHLREAAVGLRDLENSQLLEVRKQLEQLHQDEKSSRPAAHARRQQVYDNIGILEEQVRQRHTLVGDMLHQAGDLTYGIDQSRHKKLNGAHAKREQELAELAKLRDGLRRGKSAKDLLKHVDNAIDANAVASRRMNKGTALRIGYADYGAVERHPLSDMRLNPGCSISPFAAVMGISMGAHLLTGALAISLLCI